MLEFVYDFVDDIGFIVWFFIGVKLFKWDIAKWALKPYRFWIGLCIGLFVIGLGLRSMMP